IWSVGSHLENCSLVEASARSYGCCSAEDGQGDGVSTIPESRQFTRSFASTLLLRKYCDCVTYEHAYPGPVAAKIGSRSGCPNPERRSGVARRAYRRRQFVDLDWQSQRSKSRCA